MSITSLSWVYHVPITLPGTMGVYRVQYPSAPVGADVLSVQCPSEPVGVVSVGALVSSAQDGALVSSAPVGALVSSAHAGALSPVGTGRCQSSVGTNVTTGTCSVRYAIMWCLAFT